MTAFLPAYRLTVFAPRSTDATEATILTPAAGAPHSDSFKVTTLPNLAGWKPYLMVPEGKFGGLDLLTRKYAQGTVNASILDAQVAGGTAMLARWGSAFLGTASGKPQLPGCKALLEESTDGGATWEDYFTGRIVTVGNAGGVALAFQIRDNASDLNYEVFAGRPAASVTYAGEPYILPPGLSVTYGTQPSTAPLAGTFGSSGVFRTITLTAGVTGYARADNIATTSLIAGVGSGGPSFITFAAQPGLRLRFTTAGVTSKEMEVVSVDTITSAIVRTTKVAKLYCRPVSNTSDPFYNAVDTGTIADGTACTFAVRLPVLPSTTGETGASILIGDVHPVQLWADLLDGKFGRLTATGAVARSFPYDTGAFATLIADTSFPTVRFLIAKPWKLQEFVEKQLLQPFGLGMRLDGSGQVVPLDLRPLQASPTSTTIGNDDLADGPAPTWSEDRDQAITVFRVQTYVDFPLNAILDPLYSLTHTGVQTFNTTLLQAGVEEFIVPDFGSSDLGEKTLSVDAQGLRSLPGETISGHDRHEWVAARAMETASFYRKPFSVPPTYLTTLLRRTANTAGVEIGTWRLIDLDIVPGPASNLRGENRLMLCVDKSPKGLATSYRWLDAGPNSVASQPTIGTPAQEASNTRNGITVALTLNGSSEPATIWVNPTATSVGVRPADTDAGWRLAVPVGSASGVLTASATYTIRSLPANRRIWVRTRTEGVTGGKIASAYAYPAGTGYVATATITAPSSLAAGTVSTKAANLTWTVGDATKPVLLRLTGAATQVAADALTPVDYVTLPAGTSSYLLQGLDGAIILGGASVTGPWWHADVYHIDGFGGASSVNNLAAFQATGTAPTAPTPGGLIVLRDYSTSPNPPGAADGHPLVGVSGIDLRLVAAPTGFGLDAELYRAPDSAGSPGAYALLATIPAKDFTGIAAFYRDALPVTGTTYWYKWRHTGAGYSAGSYTNDTSAKAGWVPLLPTYADAEQPVLGQTIAEYRYPPEFRPGDPTFTGYLQVSASGTLEMQTTAATKEFWIGVPGRNGARLGGWFLAGWKKTNSDIVQVDLYAPTFPGGLGAALQTLTLGNPTVGGSYVTGSATFTQRLTNQYLLKLSLKANAAATDASLAYLRLDYVYDAYTQK